MSNQEVPGEGYKFPELGSPESPRVKEFPQEYGWPERPLEVHGKKRSIAMERWMAARLDSLPDHKFGCDIWSPPRSTGPLNGKIELKSPSVYTTGGRVGRFNLTEDQYGEADWIGLIILPPDEWKILHWGVYPMGIIDPLVEKECHKINRITEGWTISWKSVLREVDRTDFSDTSLVVDERNGINDFYS